MTLDYDDEETDLQSLKAESTETRHHSNDDVKDDDDDDDDDDAEKEKDVSDVIIDENGGRETNSGLQKRSMSGFRASIGGGRRHRPRQKQRQRQRQEVPQRPTGAGTSIAGVSLRPSIAGGRRRPTNAGRRKGSRYRWRGKPGRPSGGRGRSRPRPVLADDAAAVISGDISGPKLAQNKTEWKSCKQLTCVEGRGTCVSDQNEGARCRCQLGAAGNSCQRGAYE